MALSRILSCVSTLLLLAAPIAYGQMPGSQEKGSEEKRSEKKGSQLKVCAQGEAVRGVDFATRKVICAALASSQPPIIWSGGCSNTVSNAPPNASQRYCTDREDFNTAASHLSVAPSGDITVRVAGYYRINFRTIAYGCDSLIIDVDLNGSTVHQSQNKLNPPTDPAYVENAADVVWPFNVGDTLAVALSHDGVQSSCASVLYYSWDSIGSRSRLQVQYLGPIQ